MQCKTKITKDMDKFELKEMLIGMSDKLDEMYSKLISKSTDNETGEIRAKVLRQLDRLEETIKEEIYNIY